METKEWLAKISPFEEREFNEKNWRIYRLLTNIALATFIIAIFIRISLEPLPGESLWIIGRLSAIAWVVSAASAGYIYYRKGTRGC